MFKKRTRRKRRKFSHEYKAEVVELCQTSGKSIGVIAQELDLTECFGQRRVAVEAPPVRRVGWTTRDSPQDRECWARHAATEVQFYRRVNPDYDQGHGLLIPLVLRAALGRGAEVLVRAVRRIPFERIAARRGSHRAT